MIFNHSLIDQAETLLDRARTAGVMIATAESCTGGLVSGLLTEIPGSSDVVDRAFITYSNEAKTEMLGVPARIIEGHGAVSAEVAKIMAKETLLRSNADIAVSITGVAGPGGSERKPAGLVYFGPGLPGSGDPHQRSAFRGSWPRRGPSRQCRHGARPASRGRRSLQLDHATDLRPAHSAARPRQRICRSGCARPGRDCLPSNICRMALRNSALMVKSTRVEPSDKA